MNFETALQGKLNDGTIDEGSAFGRRVRRVLDMKPGNRRERIMNRMESHAKAQIGKDGEQVNWSAKTIDWSSILQMLMTLLPLILKIFGV